MDFPTFVYSRIAGAVGNLVGGTVGDFGNDFGSDFGHYDPARARIYPVMSEDDPESAPVVVFTIAGEERDDTLAGWTGVTAYSWGAKIASKKFDTAKAIEIGIKNAFHMLQSGQCRMSKHTGTEHEYEDSDSPFFVRTLTFQTYYQED